MEPMLDRVGKMADTELAKMRWALGLSGLLSIVFGVVIVVWPGISLLALTILFGAYTLATGVVGLYFSLTAEANGERGWLIVSSLLGIVVGITVLVWPDISALALLYVIGAYAIVLGILALGGAFWLPLGGGDTALMILSGLVSILFGIVMFAKPGDGALVTLALIAAFALITGISELVVAIGGKRLVEKDFPSARLWRRSRSHSRRTDQPKKRGRIPPPRGALLAVRAPAGRQVGSADRLRIRRRRSADRPMPRGSRFRDYFDYERPAPILIVYDGSPDAVRAIASAATLLGPPRHAVVLDIAPPITPAESLATISPVVPGNAFEELNSADAGRVAGRGAGDRALLGIRRGVAQPRSPPPPGRALADVADELDRRL